MRSCGEIGAMLHLYVDGELKSGDTIAVEAHLMDCRPCRQRYESLMNVVGSVRAAHPLYTATPESYEQIRDQVRSHGRRRLIARAALIAATLLIASGLWLGFARYDAFPTFAVETHLRHSRGAVPLDIRSSDPQAVESWLEPRLPFHVALPAYPDLPGAREYNLAGARLVQYRNQEAAYIAYEVNGRPVTLVITSSAHNHPSAGTSQRIGRLTFYSTSHEGLSAVSWVDKGLTYALVSDGAGASACVVCHGSTSERQKFAPLKPQI